MFSNLYLPKKQSNSNDQSKIRLLSVHYYFLYNISVPINRTAHHVVVMNIIGLQNNISSSSSSSNVRHFNEIEVEVHSA
jgi:hypothetical protein